MGHTTATRHYFTALGAAFKLVYLAEKHAHKALGSKAITLTQFKIMVAVEECRTSSQRAIADYWNTSEASVSRQIDILIEKKLLTRKRNPKEKREYLLSLTSRGRRELKNSYAALEQHFTPLFSDISHTKQRQAATMLEQLAKRLEP